MGEWKEQMDLMTGFPPKPDKLVTLSNWRKPPFNRWAFNHVSELVPSAFVRAAAGAKPLEFDRQSFTGFQLSHEGRSLGFDDWLAATYTDSLVFMKDGKVVFETFSQGQDPAVPHIWM